jgi:hypothetical protein
MESKEVSAMEEGQAGLRPGGTALKVSTASTSTELSFKLHMNSGITSQPSRPPTFSKLYSSRLRESSVRVECTLEIPRQPLSVEEV